LKLDQLFAKVIDFSIGRVLNISSFMWVTSGTAKEGFCVVDILEDFDQVSLL
jgi:hypothetical protein